MSDTAPSRADPVVVFSLGRWYSLQESSQPHPPPDKTVQGAALISSGVYLFQSGHFEASNAQRLYQNSGDNILLLTYRPLGDVAMI